MGPLIPEIISSEWSNLIALLIGLAFGYILESAGFSSSRKLAGVFYGYDFTVLKVFFTAAVTASIGLLYMDYIGWIDMTELYVLPARVWPIIVGGLIMGLGFIMGGFCPGTSVTAIAIGKMDGLAFFVGIMIGAFILSESYPFIENFYNSSNLGNITVPEYFNVSPYWFTLGVAIVAIIAFWVTDAIRKRVKRVYY